MNYAKSDCGRVSWVFVRGRDIVTETVKRLNILRFAYHKDQNKEVHKSHVFVCFSKSRVFMIRLQTLTLVMSSQTQKNKTLTNMFVLMLIISKS